MLNVSASQINGTIQYWVKLKEENKIAYFETVVEVEADLSEGNYTRSFYFDKLFFMERGEREPYYLFFLFAIESFYNARVSGKALFAYLAMGIVNDLSRCLYRD